MRLVDDDDMIETLSSDRADQAYDVRVPYARTTKLPNECPTGTHGPLGATCASTAGSSDGIKDCGCDDARRARCARICRRVYRTPLPSRGMWDTMRGAAEPAVTAGQQR